MGSQNQACTSADAATNEKSRVQNIDDRDGNELKEFENVRNAGISYTISTDIQHTSTMNP